MASLKLKVPLWDKLRGHGLFKLENLSKGIPLLPYLTLLPSEKLGPVDTGLALLTDPDSVRAVLTKINLADYSLTNTRTADKTR